MARLLTVSLAIVCDSLLLFFFPLSVSSSFPLYPFCLVVFMPASLPHDPDVVSCPESVNSAFSISGTEQLQKSAADMQL